MDRNNWDFQQWISKEYDQEKKNLRFESMLRKMLEITQCWAAKSEALFEFYTEDMTHDQKVFMEFWSVLNFFNHELSERIYTFKIQDDPTDDEARRFFSELFVMFDGYCLCRCIEIRLKSVMKKIEGFKVERKIKTGGYASRN